MELKQNSILGRSPLTVAFLSPAKHRPLPEQPRGAPLNLNIYRYTIYFMRTAGRSWAA
jgi:hypothetical protein